MQKTEYYCYAIKMRIYPSQEQKEIIKVNSDIYRTVYNKLNAINFQKMKIKKTLEHIEKNNLNQINTCALKAMLTRLKELEKAKAMRDNWSYMRDSRIDSMVFTCARRNYQAAWNMFRKVNNAGVPKYHKRNPYECNYQTCATYEKKHRDAKTWSLWNGSIRFFDNTHIRLPKVGRLRVSGSYRRVLDTKTDCHIGKVSVKMDNTGKYTATFLLLSETPFVNPKEKTKKQVGIDLNLENFLMASDGTVVDNPEFYRKAKKKIAKAKRKLSYRGLQAKKSNKKLCDSKNYQKQRLHVAKLEKKVMNQRDSFLHVQSAKLVNEYDLIVAEEMRTKNMLKDYAFSRRISDVGWRLFLEKMTYKANLYGKKFVTVDPKNTTQQCHDCGFVMGTENTQQIGKKREWVCPKCGRFHNRDYNASKNILALGLKQVGIEESN